MTEPRARWTTALAGSRLFAPFPLDPLQQLASLGTEYTLAPGEVLAHDGMLMEQVYVLLSGDLQRRSGTALAPGDIPDEVGLLMGGTYAHEWHSVGGCTLLSLPRPGVLALAAAHPQVWQQQVDAAAIATLEDALRTALSPYLGSDAETIAAQATAQGRWWNMARGETLIAAGEPIDAWYVLVTGQLCAVRGSEQARVVVGFVQPGELVGETAMLTGNVAGTTVIASRDAWLARFDLAEFQTLLLARPLAVQLLVRTLVHRMSTRSKVELGDGALALVPLAGYTDLNKLVPQLVRQLEHLGPVETLDAQRCETLGLVPDPRNRQRGDVEWLRLDAWIARQRQRGRRVLLVADAQDNGWSRQVQINAERILLIADGDHAPPATLVPPASANAPPSPFMPTRLLCLVHASECVRPSGTGAWLDATAPIAHFHARQGHEGDFARLARHVAGQAIGLALSGGGARGPAHAGIQRALHEAAVPIDFVAGTSAGAVMACLMAQDDGWERSLARSIAGIDYPPGPFSDFTIPMVAMLKSVRLHDLVVATFGQEQLEDSWIPCAVVTTNLTQARSHVFTRGPVWQAALASISPPAIAKPRLIDGDLHCDGGLTNNLPISVLREHGCRYLVASSIGTALKLTLPGGRFPNAWYMFVDRFIGNGSRTVGVPSAMEILMNATMLASEAALAQNEPELDLHLRPDLSQFGSNDFRRAHEIAATAHAQASAQLQAQRQADAQGALWRLLSRFGARPGDSSQRHR